MKKLMKKSKTSPMKKKTSPAIKKSMSVKKQPPIAVASPVEGKHHDVIQMILDDHKPLKRCIEILKNSELSLSLRRAAFAEFAPLLTIHAKAEESVLYTYEKSEIDMREDAIEGDVEHALADQMVEEVKQSVDKDIWSAKAKVLAELVEHHIKEEETVMFPELKKEADASDLIRLGEEYLAEKDKIKVDVLHPAIQKQQPTMSIRH